MCANVAYEHNSVQIYVMYWPFVIQMGTDLFKKEALFTNSLSSINRNYYKPNFLKVSFGKLLDTGIVKSNSLICKLKFRAFPDIFSTLSKFTM